MKDIIITSSRIKKELKWLLSSFVLAILFNVYAIIKHSTAWKEVVTALHIVLLLTVIFYILLLFVRLLVSLILRFATGRKSGI